MFTILYEEQQNRSAAYDDKKEIGESTIVPSESIWIIDHTFVDPTYRGNQIAEKLVAVLVDEAGKQDKKIVPLCPYALREFENKAEYEDVWKK